MINYAWMAFSPMEGFTYDDTFPFDGRVIPHGDYFLGSFTSGKYDYFQTNTGFFKKLHNSKNIQVITKKEFENASMSEEKFVFCPRLGSPQAGLTRGFKRTFSEKNKIVLDIQEKYKNGVLK